MLRFIDRLLVSPGMKETADAVSGSVVILGDNVSDYYWMNNPQEFWTLEKDFPNVAPPFEHFFIDFRAPEAIISEVNGQRPWDEAKAREWGVFFECSDIYALAKQMEQPERRQRVLATAQWQLTQMTRVIATIRDDVLPKAGGGLGKMTAHFTSTQRWYVDQYQRMRTEVEMMSKGEWLKTQTLFLERHQETNTKWLVRAHLYLGIQRDTDYLYTPTWLWDYSVTAQGQLVLVDEAPICFSQPKQQYLLQVLPHVAQSLQISLDEAIQQMYEPMVHYFYPALLTISFLHCKNVTLQPVPPSQPSPSRSKKSKKRMRPIETRITYHILDIEPMKQVLKTEGHIEQNGLKKALHICRGHFANYTDGKGLFGKYHGTYWIPQHVRGSAEQGIHLKDYRLKDVEKHQLTQEDD